MALPTLAVTPGSGATVNTLPPGGAATPANSLPVTLDTTVEAALGAATTAAITVQGGVGAVAVPMTPAATELHLGEVGGNSAIVVASLTRPANTTAYALGQIVANATTNTSVTSLALPAARKTGGTGRIVRARLSKSSPSITNASFRVHLYKVAPTTIANGDGGAWLTNESTYLDAIDVTMNRVFTDASKGTGVPSVGPYIAFDAAAGSTNIYALIEARAAYTPASGETFTLALETDRD